MQWFVQKLSLLAKHPKRLVWVIASLGLALLIADFILWSLDFYQEIPVWHGLYGFVMCVALVLGAKLMRRIVKRPENYYAPYATDSESQEKNGEETP